MRGVPTPLARHRRALALDARKDAETFRVLYRRFKREGLESEAARCRWKARELERLARRYERC